MAEFLHPVSLRKRRFIGGIHVGDGLGSSLLGGGRVYLEVLILPGVPVLTEGNSIGFLGRTEGKRFLLREIAHVLRGDFSFSGVFCREDKGGTA